jgi:DNA-binding CsgD family transcriptional regulator
VLAVEGDSDGSRSAAEEAISHTAAIDCRALAACAHSLLAYQAGSADESRRWLAIPEELGVWDATICLFRAAPGLLEAILPFFSARSRASLASALRRSNDYDLAERAGLAIGRKPRIKNSLLSPREREVHQLLRQGSTNAQIAKALFISEATVKVHVRHILEKIDARTRTEAATRLIDD